MKAISNTGKERIKMNNQAEINKAMDTLTHGVYVLGVHTPEKDNFMTAAWLCQVAGSPAMIMAAVSSSHLTAELIKKAGMFTVSVLTKDQKKDALACGTASGRDKDKISLIKNTAYTEHQIPYIDGSAACLECTVRETHEIEGNHTLFIAEVINAAADPSPRDLLLYKAKDFFG
jgi:flavin reductase (DIM6/NTAB) family NADH-FMN oxidoreductase RutF